MDFKLARKVEVDPDTYAITIDDHVLPFHTTVDGLRSETDSEGLNVVWIGVILNDDGLEWEYV